MRTLKAPHGVVLLAAYLLLLAGGWWLGPWITDVSAVETRPSTEPAVHRMLMTATAVYMITSALPFVPGAEIGFGLLLLFGGDVAALVYVGMVGALLLAFGVGRLVPVRTTAAALRACGLVRAHALVLEAEGLNRTQWLTLLVRHAPRRLVPFLLRHRHLALMLLLNLPGNALLGGGGGIALLAGMSRLFSVPGFVAAAALAVLPVPAFFAFAR
jgi:hypothetical protein